MQASPAFLKFVFSISLGSMEIAGCLLTALYFFFHKFKIAVMPAGGTEQRSLSLQEPSRLNTQRCVLFVL